MIAYIKYEVIKLMRIMTNMCDYVRDIAYDYHDWYVVQIGESKCFLSFSENFDINSAIAIGTKEEMIKLLSDISQAYADGQVIFTVPERYTANGI